MKDALRIEAHSFAHPGPQRDFIEHFENLKSVTVKRNMNDPHEGPVASWQQRLGLIVPTMKDISRHPHEMLHAYFDRIDRLFPIDRRISRNREGLSHPQYRITSDTTWTKRINPWKDGDRPPLLEGGLLARLIYGEMPEIVDDLLFAADEPAREYLAGCRSLLAIPIFDQGESLNMLVLMRKEPAAFPHEQIPDLVWRCNAIGQAGVNLFLKEELRRAYETLDQELKIVGDIQRSLLPAEPPRIPSLDLAAHYKSSRRAGGDYYDFFPLPEDKWGIIIADVSGHGTPAAGLMAVTHCILHTYPGPPMPPGKVLKYLNHHLSARYTSENGKFVTAFYGIYDPTARALTYACAGHPAPRLKRGQDGAVLPLDGAGGMPLGLWADCDYGECVQGLQAGDQLIFYTDGITEAHNPFDEMFGTDRLDQVLGQRNLRASALLDSVLRTVEEFADGCPRHDDQTLIVALFRAEVEHTAIHVALTDKGGSAMLALSRKTKDSVVVGVPDGMALQVSPMVSLIRERLEEHPHFRGRTCLLQIESVGTSVVVSGRLPTYYLKQLLQEGHQGDSRCRTHR